MEQTYMKEKPILPLLLSMALPMVLSMMVNSLYNIIDSYFVAKINENAMTALSLVFPVQNLITAVGVGFGIGINATIAYFLGAQKQEKADTSATLGIACSFLHGVILTIGTNRKFSPWESPTPGSRLVFLLLYLWGLLMRRFSSLSDG